MMRFAKSKDGCGVTRLSDSYLDQVEDLRTLVAEEYIHLGNLVEEILKHLAEATPLFQKMIAGSIHVDYRTDEGLLDRIRSMLVDPNTDGDLIAYVASELLGRTFTYQEDSIFHVARSEAPSATNAQRLLRLFREG